ncbi:MAG: phosphonate C-P lyase system protein PhnH [Cyanobacteria bacterium SBLK]|nr:phosphonate C-P lyase system protein PhnH [Cyanobacteria bacterium SBLK]
MVTQLPGFKNPVRDAQQTFRSLLDSLAQPGTIHPILVQLNSPEKLTSACAAACLTLFDLETKIWPSSSCDRSLKDWLVFHGGCRFTEHLQNANFALVQNIEEIPKLAKLNRGTSEEPESSTTLLVQVSTFTEGQAVKLNGPGILGARHLNFLTREFWEDWQNHWDYPLGIDIYFFTETEVMGLPRSAIAML